MQKAVDKQESKKDAGAPKSNKQFAFSLNPFTSTISVVFIYFASQVVALFSLVSLFVLQGKTQEQVKQLFQSNLLVQTAILVLIAATVALAVKILLNATGTSWRKIGFNKIKLAYLGQALIGYGWYYLLLIIVMPLVGVLVPGLDLNQSQQLGFDRSTTGAALGLIGISLVLIPAFYEELLMRGVLFTGLRSRLSFWVTLLITSFIFGAAHLEWMGDNPLNYAAAIDTFLLSVVLVYLRESSKSLWPAIFLHAIKNLIAFSLVFVFKVVGI
jgi:uncharacterized protein